MSRSSFPFVRPLRTSAIVCVAGAALTAAPAGVASSAGGSAVDGAAVTDSVASVPSCQTAGLALGLRARGNTLGSAYYALEFTNHSGHTCTLRGYPGVSAISGRGRQLGSAASRDNGRKTTTVELRENGTATATLRIAAAGNFQKSICRQVKAAGLRVFPPNQTASKTVRFRFPACTRRSAKYLSVQAVRP